MLCAFKDSFFRIRHTTNAFVRRLSLEVSSHMKLILPIFLIIFSTLELSGQKLARGYYVDLNNDSIPAMFKIPRRMPDYLTDIFGKQMDFPNLKEEIEIVDHRGQVQRLTPRDIKSFAFTHGATEYKRHAKPVTEYNKKFLLPEIMGKKLRLYHYAIVHPGTAHHWNGSTAKGGSSPYKEYFWTCLLYTSPSPRDS